MATSKAKKPAKAKASAKKKLRHGTRSCYAGHKCRCPACRKANAEARKREYAKKKAKTAAQIEKMPKGPKGPNLNSAEQSVRDTMIVQLRAQDWSWEAIAAKSGLSVIGAKKAHARKVASLTPLLEVDAAQILEGLMAGFQYSIGDLEQLAVAAVEERNMPAAVSAKKAANEAREKLQDLLQTTGILPHDLGTIKHQIEFRVIVVKIVDLVQNFVVQIEALDLPKDKREQVHKVAGELTTGLEHLDGSIPSTNGDGDGSQETAAAAQGGGGDSPDREGSPR